MRHGAVGDVRGSGASREGDEASLEAEMPVGVVWLMGVMWLLVGAVALYLFVTRLWGSLPPDPIYRQRLARWLAVLAVGSALYSFWTIRNARSRPGVPPGSDARSRLG